MKIPNFNERNIFIQFCVILIVSSSSLISAQNVTEITEQVPTETEDEATTTIPLLSNSTCTTPLGEPGECLKIKDCFRPLFDQGNDDQGTTDTPSTAFRTNLQEEFLSSFTSLGRSSNSNDCSPNNNETGSSETETGNSIENNEETLICCKTPNQAGRGSIIEAFEANKDHARTPPPDVPKFQFPKTCGISKITSNSSPFSSPSALFPNLSTFWNRAPTPKITGGRVSPQGQFPWMVGIFGKNGKISCGGTLITQDIVLTAAHCFASYTSPDDLKKLKLHVGDYNIMSLKDGPHEVRRISKLISHKEFDSRTFHNDIALIKMDRPVKFTDRIQPICLPNEGDEDLSVQGKMVTVAGWGRDRQWGYDSSFLRMVDMPLWNFPECLRVYKIFAPNRLKNEGTHLCAGDGRRNKDACIGDSGGPLMLKTDQNRMVQLGLVSWGKGCGSYPGVYTNIPHYIPWIQKQLSRLN